MATDSFEVYAAADEIIPSRLMINDENVEDHEVQLRPFVTGDEVLGTTWAPYPLKSGAAEPGYYCVFTRTLAAGQVIIKHAGHVTVKP